MFYWSMIWVLKYLDEMCGSHSGEDVMLIFWAVMTCGLAARYRRFGGTCCLSLQGAENEDSTFLRDVGNYVRAHKASQPKTGSTYLDEFCPMQRCSRFFKSSALTNLFVKSLVATSEDKSHHKVNTKRIKCSSYSDKGSVQTSHAAYWVKLDMTSQVKFKGMWDIKERNYKTSRRWHAVYHEMQAQVTNQTGKQKLQT
jgi:hypothetical protein